MEVSARQGTGLEGWFEFITSTSQGPRPVMNVDYEVYAEGEALLGWLNCTLRLKANDNLDGNQFLRSLAADIQARLQRAGAEVAHLKMTLDADNALGDVAVVNLVQNDYVPELSQALQDSFVAGELTINMRAQAAPEMLRDAVYEAVGSCARMPGGLEVDWQHMEYFRPGKPQPTHRVTAAA